MNIRKSITIISLISVFMFSLAEHGYASSNIANENPDPISRYLVWDAPSMQNHLFDNADSVWIDGDWHEKEMFGSRFVFTEFGTKHDASQPVISVLNLDMASSTPSLVEPMYDCPRDIGHIAIDRIAESGREKWMLLHFVSTSGVTGTFNLQTHQWWFSSVKDKSSFVNIDPIQPLHLIMPDRFIGIGTTGAWIDGDWHSKNGGFGARYVSIYKKLHSKITYIRVVEMNRGKRNGYFYYLMPLIKMYPSPRQIGHITISNIVENGTLVEFSSGSGIRGSWNVVTHQWHFE